MFATSTRTAPAPPARPVSSRAALFFCAVLLGLPLLVIPAMLLLGRSNFFLHHGASVWVQANDAIFDMHDRACDVLLFGDSTAMTGLDPRQIQQETGLRTCNIAVTNAVLAVTDTLPLDHFLAHNPAPRLLLLQFSPDGFQPEAHIWTRTIYAEGLLELLRHGSPAEIRATLLHHPREALAFTGYVAGYTAYYGIRTAWSRLTHTPLEEHTVQIRNGFFTPPGSPITACTPPEHPTPATDTRFSHTFVHSLQQRYTSPRTTVLVDLAPIPACDELLPAFTRQLSGVASNQPSGLPLALFNDQRHYTAAGARLLSTRTAAQLLAALHTTAPETARAGSQQATGSGPLKPME